MSMSIEITSFLQLHWIWNFGFPVSNLVLSQVIIPQDIRMVKCTKC